MAKRLTDQTDFFIKGCDSRNKSARIPLGCYVWGINGLNRGGVFRTRPGFNEVILPPVQFQGPQNDAFNPQGGTIFIGRDNVPYLVIAHRGGVFKCPYPFKGQFSQIPGISFFPYWRVLFEACERSNTTNKDGTVSLLENPYPVLIMQDGYSRAAYWDGINSGHLYQNSYAQAETPVGQAMKFSNQRLWVGSGNILHASNLGDPFFFTDDQGTGANQGFFVVDSDITCIGETPDLKALLVFTTETTTTFASSVLDRTLWASLVPGFQQELFDNIGCVGPLAFDNQYGISQWYSHQGMVELDFALQTYRTKRLKYSDYGMSRSKKKLSKNLTGVIVKGFQNFLLVCVPYADRYNAHIWVNDETTLESDDPEQRSSSSWAGVWKGIRPVSLFGGKVNGVDRLFALSRDYGPVPTQYQIGIWEMFCPQRADTKLDGTLKRILVGFETRKLHFSRVVKKIGFIEVMASEMKGQVDWTISYGGILSPAFKQVYQLTKIATEGALGGPLQPTIHDTDIIGGYLPQSRLIRTPEIKSANVTDQSAQRSTTGPGITGLDYAFGAYIQFVGEAGIDWVAIVADPQPEQEIGRPEQNETTARIVDWAGKEQILTAAPITSSQHPAPGEFVDSITQYFIEPTYSSR